MRIWDLPCSVLCRQHLLGEHRELHAIYSILTQNLSGYRNHPEVLRWRNKLNALRARHLQQVDEIIKRGYNHNSPINGETDGNMPDPWDPVENQIRKLILKHCECKVHS